jgi:hypothetical protein
MIRLDFFNSSNIFLGGEGEFRFSVRFQKYLSRKNPGAARAYMHAPARRMAGQNNWRSRRSIARRGGASDGAARLRSIELPCRSSSPGRPSRQA